MRESEIGTDKLAPLAIFGGRGAGVLAAFTQARAPTRGCDVVFLNDNEPAGSLIEETRVAGAFDSWRDLPAATHFLAPLHKAKEMPARAARIEALGVPGERWANVLDPAAIIAPRTLQGVGIWAQAGAMTTPSARIGSHVALRAGAHVSHDCVVEDFVNLGLGAILCGYCIVRRGAYIGAGALVRDGLEIGAFSVVGAGAVVMADVPAGAIVMGNPARHVGAA